MGRDEDTTNNSSRLATNIPVEEVKERNKCICLVVKGLSSWLIKSTLAPKSGSSLHSLYEQVSRNKVPQFLQTPLGRQYCHVKRIMEAFERHHLYAKLNSIAVASNPQLLYMLDPTLIDELDRSKRKATDFTRAQPTADALASLVQMSMKLSQRSDHNLLFSANIERHMLADTHFYFTQVSLEGHLKFLGQWNNRHSSGASLSSAGNNKPLTSLAATLTSLASNAAGNPGNLVDEMSAKTANAILKVAEFLSDDTDLSRQVSK